jgi:hypothetical protein
VSAWPDLLVRAAEFARHHICPWNLGVVPAEVLAAGVELLVNRQPQRLTIKVLEHLTRRASRQGARDPHL